jgi:hypothetical protein
MAKMKAVQVPRAGADFEIVEREIPQPGAGQGCRRATAIIIREFLNPIRWTRSQRAFHRVLSDGSIPPASNCKSPLALVSGMP